MSCALWIHALSIESRFRRGHPPLVQT
jgi:hypothetical protein